MPNTRLPDNIINEIITKARGDHETVTIDANGVPSPRGVADLQFDFPANDDDTVLKRNKVRLFKDAEYRARFVNNVGYDFVNSLLDKSLACAQHRHSMRVTPEDVAQALEYMVPDVSATMQSIVDETNTSVMDVDESSDYDGSDCEVDDEDEISIDESPTFDETYPPVDGITASDVRFKDEVMMPIFRENFRMSDFPLQRKSRILAGFIKNAMYAYLVGKLSAQYQILDQLEEASTLLELALWKTKIGGAATEMSEAEREQSRVMCGADVVVSNVLPYLFTDVSANRDRTFDWAKKISNWAKY